MSLKLLRSPPQFHLRMVLSDLKPPELRGTFEWDIAALANG
jgi:hypothetical protein